MESRQGSQLSPFKKGESFKNGKLYVFTDSGVTVTRAWPPMAWKKTIEQPYWCNEFPKQIYKRAFNYSLKATDQELSNLKYPVRMHFQFFNTIPLEVRQWMVAFGGYQEWKICAFSARVPGALDLFHSNPVLAFSLANNGVFHPTKKPWRKARSCIQKKQKYILSALGFPGTDQMRKLFLKILPASCDIVTLLFLRKAIRENAEILKRFSHLPKINKGVIDILSNPGLREFASHSLLCEVAKKRNEISSSRTHMTLLDTKRMIEIRNTAPPVFSSLNQLHSVHNDEIDILNLRDTGRSTNKIIPDNREFDEPPFGETQLPDNFHVVPLKSAGELSLEGKQQKNCIYSYAKYVGRGISYIYQMLQPERATFMIRKNGDKWNLSEIKGPCNQKIAFSTVIAVRKWLEENQT